MSVSVQNSDQETLRAKLWLFCRHQRHNRILLRGPRPSFTFARPSLPKYTGEPPKSLQRVRLHTGMCVRVVYVIF